MHLVKTEQDMVRNYSSIQFGFFFSFHLQPVNIIHFMKTNSTILRDASVHKIAFYCHHNTVLENEQFRLPLELPRLATNLTAEPSSPLEGGSPVIYLLPG